MEKENQNKDISINQKRSNPRADWIEAEIKSRMSSGRISPVDGTMLLMAIQSVINGPKTEKLLNRKQKKILSIVSKQANKIFPLEK